MQLQSTISRALLIFSLGQNPPTFTNQGIDLRDVTHTWRGVGHVWEVEEARDGP